MARTEKTVFISYRRKDIAWALNVYRYLTSHGYDVFFDYTSISSGDFEQIIVSNIKARAHFLVILTPSALDRCSEPNDWLRREIETAIQEKRNIVPLFFDDFNFSSPSVSEKLTGQLAALNRYNGLEVPVGFFDEAMERLSKKYLNVALNAVLHPISDEVQEVVKKQKVAADQAVMKQPVKVEQPAKNSKKHLVGVYGRLVVLALMVLGFFGPWFIATSEPVPSARPADVRLVGKVLGALGTAGGPGADWYLPEAERGSPFPYSSDSQLVDPALFDLEAVLEEIAPEIAAS